MITEYNDGYLIYDVIKDASISLVCELIKTLPWDDGYIAFSQGEFRWRGNVFNEITDLSVLFNNKHEGKGFEGYVMEADLWRQDGGFIFEELAIERYDDQFFIQHWQLHTSKDTIGGKDYLQCYYRYAPKVIPLRQSKLFKKGEIQAIEVIVPEYRLHIFLTKRGE